MKDSGNISICEGLVLGVEEIVGDGQIKGFGGIRGEVFKLFMFINNSFLGYFRIRVFFCSFFFGRYFYGVQIIDIWRIYVFEVYINVNIRWIRSYMDLYIQLYFDYFYILFVRYNL